MSNPQADVLTLQKEEQEQEQCTLQTDQAAQPSKIKIRFKKGAVFTKSDDLDDGDVVMGAHLLLNLSPNGKKKRNMEENDDNDDEHDVKRTKTEDGNKDDHNTETVERDVTNGTIHVTNKATGTSGNKAAATAGTSDKKVPIQAASIYKKLSRKLSDQPLLLEHLREYRSSISTQHREDINTIAKLQAELGAMTKEAAEKELRAAENLKASQDMVSFWTESFNDEYEGSMLLKQKIHEIAEKIEALNHTAIVGDVGAGFGKGMEIEVELRKLGIELTNLANGRN